MQEESCLLTRTYTRTHAAYSGFMLAHLASPHLQLDFYSHLIGGDICFPQRRWLGTSRGFNLSALCCDAAGGKAIGSVSARVFTRWSRCVLVSHLGRWSIFKQKSKNIHLKRCRFPPPKRWELSCCDSVLLFNIKAFHKQNEIESIESTAQPRASSSLFSQRAAPVHTVFLSETPVSSNIPKTWTSGCLTTPKVVLRCPRFQQWSGDLSRLWPREAPGALQTPPVHEKSQELNATLLT